MIKKAWHYLTITAMQADGKIGYVQPIGEKAIPGQTINADSQANFGVGAFLLAACEYVKYLRDTNEKHTIKMKKGGGWFVSAGAGVSGI